MSGREKQIKIKSKTKTKSKVIQMGVIFQIEEKKLIRYLTILQIAFICFIFVYYDIYRGFDVRLSAVFLAVSFFTLAFEKSNLPKIWHIICFAFSVLLYAVFFITTLLNLGEIGSDIEFYSTVLALLFLFAFFIKYWLNKPPEEKKEPKYKNF